MRRLLIGLLAALLGALFAAPAVAAASPLTGVAKVVLIVGPAGAATDRYRAEANSAAALARRYTPDVTEIYSPNATWPAVKQALQGASLVIYMGHGNGWPSRYRDSLYPPTQNGFGLNPEAGGDDGTHQYFGESKIASDVRLAPNAVVLLNHLCYASGNSEPGLPEGSLVVAKRRVDNFAAGFVAAGAAAVVAEAWSNPNFMVRTVLGGRGRIESAWRNAPTSNGHRLAFESVRSDGYVAEMDPDNASSGFHRSIVLKRGLASSDVLRTARGRTHVSTQAVDPVVLIPSLTSTGLALKTPVLRSNAAGNALWYRIPYAVADRDKLPDDIQASVRWDPLDPLTPGPNSTTPTDPSVVPDFGLVMAERIGDVVAPTELKIDKKNLSIRVTSPATPGRYRLSVMLHDKDGVAYDAATQAMLQSLIVRLTGPHDAAIVAPSSLELDPGEATSLPLWVTNLGREAWGQKAVPGTKTIDSRRLVGGSPATRARIVGSWVSLGGIDDPAQLDAAAAASVTPTSLPPAFAPRAVTKAGLVMFAPSTAGDYLLVIDIVTPEVGSLAAQGVEPVTVRIHVAPKPVEPSPSPTVQPTAAAPSLAAPSVAPAAGASAAPSAAPSVFAEPTERR